MTVENPACASSVPRIGVGRLLVDDGGTSAADAPCFAARLLCVTDHLLPEERRHWVSPACLGRVVHGEATNCEPAKTLEVRWFGLHELPPNLTITARRAIEAHQRRASIGAACYISY